MKLAHKITNKMYVPTPLYLKNSATRTSKEERRLFSNLSVKKFKGCHNFDYIPTTRSVLIKNSFKVVMNEDFRGVIEDVMDKDEVEVKGDGFLKVIEDLMDEEEEKEAKEEAEKPKEEWNALGIDIMKIV